MSDGSEWFNHSTTSANSLGYTRQPPLTSNRQQLPSSQPDDQLNFFGFGVNTINSGVDQGVPGYYGAQTIDPNHTIHPGYNGDVRVQSQFSAPWTPYSPRQVQAGRPTAAGSRDRRLDVPQWPANAPSSRSAARNSAQTQPLLNPYQNVDPSTTWDAVVSSSSLPRQHARRQSTPYQSIRGASAGSPFQLQVPLSRTNLQQQQLQFPPTVQQQQPQFPTTTVSTSRPSNAPVPIPRKPSDSGSRGPRTDRPWECDKSDRDTGNPCGKRFKREGDLDRHLETQHGNTFYQCAHCDHQNCRLDKMREHCRKHHGQFPNPVQYVVVFDNSD